MRVLRATPIAVRNSGESEENAKNMSIYDNGVTSVFLYTIIVELTIKGLWSYENGGVEPEHTHDIQKLFDQLTRKTQSQIKSIYNNICRSYKQAILAGKQKLGAGNIQVEMASLKEALQWNERAIVALKYDLELKGKTVPAGVIWDNNFRNNHISIWIGNYNLPNFASKIVEWARVKHSI